MADIAWKKIIGETGIFFLENDFYYFVYLIT